MGFDELVSALEKCVRSRDKSLLEIVKDSLVSLLRSKIYWFERECVAECFFTSRRGYLNVWFDEDDVTGSGTYFVLEGLSFELRGLPPVIVDAIAESNIANVKEAGGDFEIELSSQHIHKIVVEPSIGRIEIFPVVEGALGVMCSPIFIGFVDHLCREAEELSKSVVEHAPGIKFDCLVEMFRHYDVYVSYPVVFACYRNVRGGDLLSFAMLYDRKIDGYYLLRLEPAREVPTLLENLVHIVLNGICCSRIKATVIFKKDTIPKEHTILTLLPRHHLPEKLICCLS